MYATVSSSISVSAPKSWKDLQTAVGETSVGRALNREVEHRRNGYGSPHVHNTLRKFESSDDPLITLYRDHAGWCPYCQKAMLLIEEKQIPIKISLVPMRSYGDKPREFLAKVPSGLLPAISVQNERGQEQIITESQVIMELLDGWYTPKQGYRAMMPSKPENQVRYKKLARLERELFSWWCTLVFRPESLQIGGGGNPLNRLFGTDRGNTMSGSMQSFLDCLQKVDDELLSTSGPWFFDEFDYPTMIDFIYISHVERMLASCAYWKGLNLRDPKWKLNGLNRWIEAFEKREAYLAFKSDYFTHVMDIPPQYGPGYDGGFDDDRTQFVRTIIGRDKTSWHLPLAPDDPLQPLYKGVPLPLHVLEAVNLTPDADGSYESSKDSSAMEEACRTMAAWKLASNGLAVAKFAARGGPKGAKNPRKNFGAQLADPYAEPDAAIQPLVDTSLRIVCDALYFSAQNDESCLDAFKLKLQKAIPTQNRSGVQSSLAYLRDRVGVPRDLPLAAARYLRAYLNWAIDILE